MCCGCRPDQRHDRHGVAPGVGHVQRLAVGAAGQARRHELVGRLADRQFLVVAQIAFAEGELMHHLELAAAGKQPLAGRVEAQAVKRLVERDARRDAVAFEINQHDLMLAVASVQHGGPRLVGMQGDIHRKVAQLDLLAAGRSDHWFGSKISPAGWAPGKRIGS